MSRPNAMGGKKYKKKKRNNFNKERMLEIADNGQVYGKVIKKLGGDFMKLLCSDGQERMGYIRGKMRKKEWLNENDIVLCTLNSFGTDISNKNKCTIELKYRMEEIHTLESQGRIQFRDNEDIVFENNVTIEKKQLISFDDVIKPMEISENNTNDDDFFGNTDNTNNTNNEINSGDYNIDDLLDLL